MAFVMGRNYVLGGPDGHTPILEPSIVRWTRWRRRVTPDELRVARDTVDGHEVATAFLGATEHAASAGTGALFETTIDGDWWTRYDTWEEAEEGHRAIVETLREGDMPLLVVRSGASYSLEPPPDKP